MSVAARYRSLVAEGHIRFDAGQEEAALKLDTLADALTSYKPGLLGALFGRKEAPRGLYLWGDVGRGKSMLMDLFYGELAIEEKRRVHFNLFMAGVHQMLHKLRADETVADPLPLVADKLQQRVLCFDEFQVEDVADAMILGRLFEQLLARGTVIVATSNTPPERLYMGGLNRQLFLPFIGLIQARMEVVELLGEDHRRDFAGSRYCVGPDGPAAMDRVWRALGGEYEHMRTLSVLGRALTIPRAVETAARFTFAELCEAPLGPADYLAIAGAFQTLVIDAIPVLTERNSAKRFTTLIDALYDAKCGLYCAAAAEPDALYPEGGESFQRTISRLLEMRSDTYIERATL
ncbi:cell division protein ZapE [Rhizomicrobium palustre]|uniref:Cell division protein ZapE n=1 Tax=Rhizomicrobium palustre TaxID=189966 RepID=A0A846MXW8_9PROT|nr:cell division protein ZapE [Rhizomicrobium palustre]NIK87902.1 cell division protein ZapE [Rhizomicrobium palustre]